VPETQLGSAIPVCVRVTDALASACSHLSGLSKLFNRFMTVASVIPRCVPSPPFHQSINWHMLVLALHLVEAGGGGSVSKYALLNTKAYVTVEELLPQGEHAWRSVSLLQFMSWPMYSC